MSGFDRDAGAKLDRLMGKVDALIVLQNEQTARIDGLAERTVRLEEGVARTRDLVAAWSTAKASLRFLRWVAALTGAIGAGIAAVRGWLGR